MTPADFLIERNVAAVTSESVILDPGIPDSCPFCAHTESEPEYVEDDEEGRPLFYVTCLSCESSGPWAVGEELAIKVWNSRATQPVQTFESSDWKPQARPKEGDEVWMPEAIPCPFCGHDVVFCFSDPEAPSYLPTCGSCAGNGPECTNRADALKAWNTRPSGAVPP